MCAMFCKSCGRSLFDSGEERFYCPYCGAEVVADSVDSNGMPLEVGKSADCGCGDSLRSPLEHAESK